MMNELELQIEKLLPSLGKAVINYDRIFSHTGKVAYPNHDSYMAIPGSHNTQKWLESVKNIYQQEQEGVDRIKAIRRVTSGWAPMETYDFLNWLKYYEEGAHMKYKFAQNWYESEHPGYMLHIKKDPAPDFAEKPVSGRDINFAQEDAAQEFEKKKIIEKQRQKIIGRLDSIEKLLRGHEGQLFSGQEFSSLMDSIYDLKKKVHLINKLSASNKTYEDMIFRQGNVLRKNGFVKAAEMLFSIAQDPSEIPPAADAVPAPEGTTPPTQNTGEQFGGFPYGGPGSPAGPQSEEANNTPLPSGLSKFLENLDTANVTKHDDNNAEDDLEVFDASDDLLISEAQDAPIEAVEVPPVPTAAAPTGSKPAADAPIEVKDGEVPEKSISSKVKEIDNMFNAAFANITVSDIVAKLEDLSAIFKTRELPRQLAMIDIMLDSLGLASYFPSLSEATNKSLESNNYISTRVDDILAKLRGSMGTSNIDLEKSKKPLSPEVEAIKGNLQRTDDKEKAKKDMRKNLEDKALEDESKETPEIDMQEGLAEPAPAAPVLSAPPAPVK